MAKPTKKLPTARKPTKQKLDDRVYLRTRPFWKFTKPSRLELIAIRLVRLVDVYADTLCYADVVAECRKFGLGNNAVSDLRLKHNVFYFKGEPFFKPSDQLDAFPEARA